MGDSWISPVDAVLSWGPYLYATVSLLLHIHTAVRSVYKTHLSSYQFWIEMIIFKCNDFLQLLLFSYILCCYIVEVSIKLSLSSQSLVDSAGEGAIDNKTAEVAVAVKTGKMADSTKLWAEAEGLVETVTNGVNFYNILKTPARGNASVNHNHVLSAMASRNKYRMKSPELGKYSQPSENTTHHTIKYFFNVKEGR